MNNKFKDDYYRMTGTKFSIVSGIVNVICRHNIRYVLFWRLRNTSPNNLIYKILCHTISKKYGLEIGNSFNRKRTISWTCFWNYSEFGGAHWK